jgi:hypothetical protein
MGIKAKTTADIKQLWNDGMVAAKADKIQVPPRAMTGPEEGSKIITKK